MLEFSTTVLSTLFLYTNCEKNDSRVSHGLCITVSVSVREVATDSKSGSVYETFKPETVATFLHVHGGNGDMNCDNLYTVKQ